MTTWVIISWVFVALLTAGNIFFFLKLKSASDQMMKMAFPGSKNMGDAMSQMQNMMKGMQGRGGANPFAGGGAGAGMNPQMQQQMKMAMDMLSKIQQPPGKKK